MGTCCLENRPKGLPSGNVVLSALNDLVALWLCSSIAKV